MPAAPSKRTRVLNELDAEVAQGHWPVGVQLPSETQLMIRFGVGRQTVRHALSDLRGRSLIESHQGVGSVVVRQQAIPEYSQSLDSINELLFYARSTSVSVLSTQELTLDDTQASVIRVQAGERWIHAMTLRTAHGQSVPMGLSSIWVPASSRPAVLASHKSGLPVFLEVQKASGLIVSHVQQVIGASLPDKQQAKLLQCARNEPLLRIQRWYRAADDTLLEMSDSLHPTARFQYAMTLRRSIADVQQSYPRKAA